MDAIFYLVDNGTKVAVAASGLSAVVLGIHVLPRRWVVERTLGWITGH